MRIGIVAGSIANVADVGLIIIWWSGEAAGIVRSIDCAGRATPSIQTRAV